MCIRDRYPIVADLLAPGDLVVLVIPIDESAPKGRLILPQQQTIREVLDCHASAVCVQDTDLKAALAGLGTKPRLVITDSQAFARVSADTVSYTHLTYDEYQELAESRICLSYNPAAVLAGQTLEERLSQKHLHLPLSYEPEEIRENLQRLAAELSLPLPDFAALEREAEAALARARDCLLYTSRCV